MNILKKLVGSIALGAALITTVGVASFAQDRNRNDQSQQRRSDRDYGQDDRVNDRRNNDRYDQRNQRRDDRRDNDHYDRGNGGWDNDQYENNGYARKQMEKGYRDGFKQGRKEVQSNRQRMSNNSRRYQDNNPYYRQGFERGFNDAYNQYRNDRRGRRW